MKNPGLKYLVNDSSRQLNPQSFHNQKNRQTYISPNRALNIQNQKNHHLRTNTTNDLKKAQSINQEAIPPRATLFRRTHNESIDKKDKDRSGYHSNGKAEEGTKDILRFSALRKRLQDQIKQRERLQEANVCQLLKIQNLTQQINKLRGQKKELEKFILEIQKTNEQNNGNLIKAQQNIEQLTKNLKESRLNQKSLNNLKNIQNQLDLHQERNKKLTQQKEQLMRQNADYKLKLDKYLKESTDSDSTSICSGEVKRLLGQLQKSKSQRERFLEANLLQLQKKLYDTENEIKKLLIQLNCIDRKKVISINQVRATKDQQIKDLRQKFIKVTKDLRQTKDKIQKKDKKRPKQSPIVRKYKSSKNLGIHSESEELTFQFSSEV